tara:strand:- start:1864 stop:2928 length:1065 start_codon:yes stop_codon:yes gene_type:complete
MGLFKSIKKAFKKVTRGIKKAVKGVVKGVKKVVKKISSSKILKALAIAAAVVVTGGAAVAAFTGGTAASGTFAGWMMNASQAVTGGTLFGTSTAVARAAGTAAKFIATPFATVGAAAGNAAAALTDFTGLTTEAGRTSVTTIAEGTAATTPYVSEPLSDPIVTTAQGTASTTPYVSTPLADPVVVTPGTAGTGARTLGPQLDATNTITAQGTTATTPYVSTPLADPIVTTAQGTAIPGVPISTPLADPIVVTPTEKALSITQRYPKTTAFLSGAAGSAASTMFGVYANSLMAGDPTGRGGSGIGEEGGARKDPISIYSNELNINPDDYSKYFTFSNTAEAGNMPLFQQQTIEVA